MGNQVSRTLSTAPMMDWTDAHCRYFFSLLSPSALLYTEMIPTNAIVYGKKVHLIKSEGTDAPVSLQLGGNNPQDLARVAEIGEKNGFSEINLNCGCPSDRVVNGLFGAALMKDPYLVKRCLTEMKSSVSIPVTVKHRLGIDSQNNYDFARNFVDIVSESGCEIFIIHARNAILRGLSPTDNRRIPPLKYNYVYRLKKDFPHLKFILNGGLDTVERISDEIARCDGVMIGRAAYQDPYLLAQIEKKIFNKEIGSRETIAKQMECYAKKKTQSGTPIRSITKCMLGLFKSQPNGRIWRQILSNNIILAKFGPETISYALSILSDHQRPSVINGT